MYQAHYINPLFQFDKKVWRLICTDDAGELPELRFEKEFWGTTTRAYLKTYANARIAAYLALLDEPRTQDEITPTIDLPEGEELA